MWNKLIKYRERLLFISLVLSVTVSGQEPSDTVNSSKPVLIDATLIFTNDDSLNGKILYRNQYEYQFRIILTDTIGNVIEYYTPKDLRGFIYVIDSSRYRYDAMDNPMDIGKVFLRLMYRGENSVYQFLEANQRNNRISFRLQYYIWNEVWRDPPITPENTTWALLKHFSDCPELEYKIKTGEYGFSSMAKILREYEKCSLTDRYEFFYE